GGPGVGVVCAREFLGRVAIGVERVLDDVVALGADEMQEELAGECGQLEARAHGAAVDREAGWRVGQRLLPGRERRARVVEELRPVTNAARAVPEPVIRGDDARVAAAAVPEE